MLATLILSIIIFVIVIITLLWVRTPRYRIERHNIISLLELVLEGRANENDWRVFAASPLRHNEYLDSVRERCLDIEEREYLCKAQSKFLFSRQGLLELSEVLKELKESDQEDSFPQ